MAFKYKNENKHKQRESINVETILSNQFEYSDRKSIAVFKIIFKKQPITKQNF